MASITYHRSLDYHRVSETRFLQIEGEKGFDARIVEFFQDYFSKENPLEKGKFHLKDKGKYYFVRLEVGPENPRIGPNISKVTIASYQLAHLLYKKMPSEEKFIKYLERMQEIREEEPIEEEKVIEDEKIGPKGKLQPLYKENQRIGFRCKGIPFFYSREFQLQMEGQKSGSHHVSLGDHFISEEVLEAVLVNTTKHINRKKNKPLGVVTRHFLVDGSKVFAFVFARNPNGSCFIISMFYPARSSLKQGRSETQYNAWLESLPKINL